MKPFNDESIATILEIIDNCEIVTKRKFKRDENGNKYSVKIPYYNIPCAFDIETSSFYDNGEKRGIMYIWMFGVSDFVIYGRTWGEFIRLNQIISERHPGTRLPCAVHGLGFEFQFMRYWFHWIDSFNIDIREPCRSVNEYCFEFRDTLVLCGGSSLAYLGDHLRNPIQKMTGDLDYSKIRHSETPLTEKELGYCEHDILILLEYMREKIDDDGDVSKILMTNTGYVRKAYRESCLPSDRKWKMYRYRDIIKSMPLTVERYRQLKRAFQGGFTHGAFMYFNQTVPDVTSCDLCSAYPAVLVMMRFPMGEPIEMHPKSRKELDDLSRSGCWICDIKLKGVEEYFIYDHYISKSKCYVCNNFEIDNGRIVRADEIVTTITNVDWDIIKRTYKIESISIANFRYYKKEYLPTSFIRKLLDLYVGKTSLKGIPECSEEYSIKKSMLNASFGMMVTDICKMIIEYLDEWDYNIMQDRKKLESNTEKCIEEYNTSFTRFLSYEWGVWCTAYVRKIIFGCIQECGSDHCYTDTDSEKHRNHDAHKEWFEQYNNKVREMMRSAMEFHKLPFEMVEPKTKAGKPKLLGVFETDGEYTKFRQLGAKRYMVEYIDKDGNRQIEHTIAGLKKRDMDHDADDPEYVKTVYDLLQQYDDPFQAFTQGLHVPGDYTGKLTHSYIDDEHEGDITDYLGNVYHYHEKSAVHLQSATYDFTIDHDWLEWLIPHQEISVDLR